MTLLRHHPEEVVKIPSYNELAPLLGVARSSAQKALRKLVREGVLEAKVGIGTFSVPKRKGTVLNEDFTLIGVLLGEGRHAYYGYYECLVFASLFNALSRYGAAVLPVRLVSTEGEAALREIRSLGLEGLAVLEPAVGIRAILPALAKEIPTVVFMTEAAGCDCVYPNMRATGERLARFLLEQGKRRILLSPSVMCNRKKNECLHEAYEAAGLTLTDRNCCDPERTLEEQLEARLKLGWIPDALLINTGETHMAEMLLRKYHVPVPDKCLVICPLFAPNDTTMPVTEQRLDLVRPGRKAADLLFRRIAGWTGSYEMHEIDCNLGFFEHKQE